VGWIWDRTSSDPRYMSSIDVQWEDVHRALGDLNGEHKKLRIGLVNFNSTEYGSWRQIFSKGQVSNVRLEPVKDGITWQTLYPEWIDEEEEYDIPSCPSLPEPNVRRGVRFDVIAVKLPCTRVAGWSRDVARLHLQLSAGKLAVASSSSTRNHKVHVLFVTECFPMPNLFPCKSLVRHQGNAWLYSPDMKALREKLRLPVGSCELAVPLKSACKLFTLPIATFPLFMECVCVVSLFFSEHDQRNPEYLTPVFLCCCSKTFLGRSRTRSIRNDTALSKRVRLRCHRCGPKHSSGRINQGPGHPRR
jgi:xylan alpha-glucuronosyltransferase